MSFFGFGATKKSPNSPSDTSSVDTSKLTSPVYDTGRNVDDIVLGLLNAINDTEASVRNLIHDSLLQIGENEPVLVLSKGLSFLNKVSRSQKVHRVLVMNAMSEVVDQKQDLKLPDDLSTGLVVMAAMEIVAEKSISSEWQNAACKLLISLSRVAPDVVAKQLFERFPSNSPPHYFIVKAFADFAHTYPQLFLPHLKEVISRSLPILASLKQDNLKWVFCAGLGRWAEALVRCKRENKTNVPTTEYSSAMHAALKHSLQEWLVSREGKIRLAAAEAIGYMCHIIETDQLNELLGRVLKGLLELMKREKDQLPITIGLQNVIYVVVRDCSASLSEHVDILLKEILSFLIAAIKIENTNAKTEQNMLELLKCYEIIGKQFTDQVISFLQKHVESKEPIVKLVVCRAFKHLVTTLDKELNSYKDVIVGGLRLFQQYEDTKIHLEFSRLIFEMGAHGYLLSHGGTELVTVVIQGASITDEAVSKQTPTKPGTPSLEDLRNECDEILNKFSTEYGEQMDNVLWPYLMEHLVPGERTASFSILCKCISDIAKRKKNDDDFIIDYDRTVNVPKPNQLFARLIIMLNEPYGRNSPGVNILRALYCLSPNIHPDLVEVWSKLLPKMKRYIDAEDSFNQDQWENYLLNLVRDSIDAVNDDGWNVQFGDALLEQMKLYNGKRGFKRTILSIIGLVIQKTSLKEFIHRGVSELFEGTDHSSDVERLGCARGLGQASATCTDVVLTKLQTVVKTQVKKQSGGFSLFGAAKPTGPVVTNSAKATALLSYGYVCMLTPLELITSRVEVHVVNNVLQTLQSATSHEVKENGLRAIDLIGKSVHPSRLEKFVLKSRDDLVKTILSIMNPSEPAKIDNNLHRLRVLGLEALSTLINLPPTISIDIQSSILNNTLNILKTETDDKTTEELLVQNLNSMLTTILLADPSQGTLDDLLRALEPFIRSRNVLERVRSSSAYLILLKEFARIISENKPDNDALNTCGRIIAKLVPRVTESNIEVRQSSIDCIYVALRIHYYLKLGQSAELPEFILRIGPLRSRLDTDEPHELFGVAKELATILTEAVDKSHLANLIENLFDTLDDGELDGANGSCVILNGLVRIRGSELELEATKFVKRMIELMAQLKDREQIVTGLLHAVRGFARHFSLQIINTLIGLPVPHSVEVTKSFQIIAADPKLAVILIDYLIDIVNNSQLYEEKKKDNKMDLVATHNPKSATAAFAEMLDIASSKDLAVEYYSKILVTGLLRLGSANAMTTEQPAKDAQLIIKNLFTVTEEEDVLKKLNKKDAFSKMVSQTDYADSIYDTLHIVCAEHPEYVPKMFEFCKQFISRTFTGHRIPATCIIAVLLYHMKNDRDMIYDAINSLLGRSGTDEQVVVKLHALKGLANLTQHPKDIMHKFVTPIIGALISNLEDSDESVIMQAMKSVREIFDVAEDEYIAPLLLNLCVRLKPSFEKSNPQIREASIQLFGSLARFCKGTLGDTLINTIHANLPTILLHLQDNDVTVVRACKVSLRQLVAELKSTELIQLFETEELDVKSTPEQEAKSALQSELFDFDQFAERFAACWVKEFPDRISDIVMNMVVFYKSDWAGVCAGACLIIGYIVAKINKDQKQRVNLRHTCTGMVQLLKSPSPLIREKVSKILGLLYEA